MVHNTIQKREKRISLGGPQKRLLLPFVEIVYRPVVESEQKFVHLLAYIEFISPYTSLLYRNTWVYKGIPIILIFYPKNTLWVLVRTASAMYI